MVDCESIFNFGWCHWLVRLPQMPQTGFVHWYSSCCLERQQLCLAWWRMECVQYTQQVFISVCVHTHCLISSPVLQEVLWSTSSGDLYWTKGTWFSFSFTSLLLQIVFIFSWWDDLLSSHLPLELLFTLFVAFSCLVSFLYACFSPLFIRYYILGKKIELFCVFSMFL